MSIKILKTICDQGRIKKGMRVTFRAKNTVCRDFRITNVRKDLNGNPILLTEGMIDTVNVSTPVMPDDIITIDGMKLERLGHVFGIDANGDLYPKGTPQGRPKKSREAR